MDNRLKESISALMDDEANELELQRLLSHVEPDELRDTWQRYHLVRDLMREDAASADSHMAMHLDIHARVAEQIARESGDDVVNAAESGTSMLSASGSARRMAGLASVAASVAFASVFVWQNLNAQGEQNQTPAFAQTALQQNETIAAHREPKMIETFSEAHARRFNEYLLRHAEQTVGGFSPSGLTLARVASVNSVGI